MQSLYRIAVLAGDGIGPEVTAEAVKVLKAIEEIIGPTFRFQNGLIGGTALDQTASPLPAETIAICNNAHAVLLGAVGGPQWDTKRPESRPEAGLLQIRQRLGLFVNLRPAKVMDSLVGISALKPNRVRGTDLVIVRELMGGIYFGNPRGIFAKNGERYGVNTEIYREHEVERVAHRAFQLARLRRRKVTSVDKANVLSSSVLWRRVANRVAADYPDVSLEHLLVDACAMHLIRRPKDFDVIVTENLFGDILTDEASMLAGSLGMLPSASLGTQRTEHGLFGLYEPIHGSAPDIAGQDKANPIATILSAALLLRYSLGLIHEAAAIENAVEQTIAEGYRTEDMREVGVKVVGTQEMGRQITTALTKVPA